MKDYFGYAPAVVVPRIMSALVLIFFSRVLTPEEVGVYALIIVIGEYLDTIFCRWIRSGYTRIYFSAEKNGEKIDVAVMQLMIPGLLLSVAFALAYAGFSEHLDLKWAALLCLYVTSNFILYQGLEFLRVRGMSRYYTLIELGRSTFGFVVAVALTHLIAPTYDWLMIGMQSFTLVAAGLLLAKILSFDPNGRIGRTLLKEIWSYSGPLIIVYFLAGTTLIIDRIMLEHIAGPALLGVYIVSYQLARPPIDMLFNIVNLGSFPKLVAAYEAEGDVGANRILYQKSVATSIVAFPVLGFILASSSQISEILLRGDFAKFAPLTIIIISVATFLRGWVRFCVDQVFLLRRTTTDQIHNLIPSILATIAVAYLLIPFHAVYGAAFSVLVGSVVEAILAVRRARKQIRFKIIGREIVITFSASLLGAVLIASFANAFGIFAWVGSAVLVAILYALLIVKFGIFKGFKP